MFCRGGDGSSSMDIADVTMKLGMNVDEIVINMLRWFAGRLHYMGAIYSPVLLEFNFECWF